MLEYLKSKEDFVDLIVKHLGTSAVMDLLLRLITSVESPQLRQDLLEVSMSYEYLDHHFFVLWSIMTFRYFLL